MLGIKVDVDNVAIGVDVVYANAAVDAFFSRLWLMFMLIMQLLVLMLFMLNADTAVDTTFLCQGFQG